MPKLTCPIGQCTWESQDLEAEFAGALTTSLQAHLTHAHPIDVGTKPEKLPRPSISKGVTTEDGGISPIFGAVTMKLRNYPQMMHEHSSWHATTQNYAFDLHRTDNQLGRKLADIIMATIKSLAVRQENTRP